MKSLFGNAILIGLAAATASVVACSSAPATTGGHGSTASNTEDGTGTIGLQLTLPGGEQINTVNYTVNGPNGASTIVTQGTINVGSTTSIFFDAPGIPAGSGYTVTLSAADDAGDTCLGTSAAFAVTARTETNVLVQLQCHATANQNGSATITGVTSNCATWQSVATNPGSANVGSAALISFSATGPDKGSLTFSTSVSGTGTGTLSPASGAVNPSTGGTAAFTCTGAGAVGVTFVFADGTLPDGGSCDTTLDTVTVTVECNGTVADSGVAVDSGTPDTGVATADSGPPDTGVVSVDSGPPDTGAPDAGAPPDICTPFDGPGTHCTATEAAFVQHDPSGACYTCLVNNGGLDDVVFPDTGHECGDLTTASDVSACLATLNCILGSTPNAPTCAVGGAASLCYCGAGVGPAACSALSAAPNGQCTAQEAAGLDLPTFPVLPVLKAFNNTTLPSGVVNAIFTVAQQNSCSTCF